MSETRLDELFAHFSKIGICPNGGVARLGYSEDERAAHAAISILVNGLDVEIETDEAGNTYVYNRAACLGNRCFVAGSHLDSVPNGGNFDGVVGVVGALEVLRRLHNDRLIERIPFKAVAFACEESSRFGISSIGSRLAFGQLNPNILGTITDGANISISAAMSRLGFTANGTNPSSYLSAHNTAAYLELHVEQGPTLDAEHTNLGIVSAISASKRLKVQIDGVPSHTGATPMNGRRDALVAAARLIQYVETAAIEENEETCVATVGRIKVVPNVTNVIPGTVELWIDIRDIDSVRRERVAQKIETFALDDARFKVAITCLQCDEPQPLDGAAVDALKRAVRSCAFTWKMMASGAGHDALYAARGGIPTAMLFVPSKFGISHQPNELTELEDIERGVEVLYKAVLDLWQH